jgi:preprotein translocase subunit SecG
MPGFLIGLITTLHVAVCIGLMAAILLQSGKGGGLAGTFGAGSSQTLFGGRGAATFLSRATTALAVTFFLTSLTLGLQASRAGGTRRSLIQEDAARRRTQQGGGAQAPAGGAQAPDGGAQGGAPQSPGPGASQTPAVAGPPGPVTAAPSPAPAGGATKAPATGGK